MANYGQQMRLSLKLQRNLNQVLTATDGLIVNRTVNAQGDNIIEVTDGSWASGDNYALIKFQEIPVSNYPVVGLPVHKIMICVEAAAAGHGQIMDTGMFSEIVCRAKDLGCAIEIYMSANTVQPTDQATAGGNFGAGLTAKRYIRASVDTIGFGQ